MALRWLVVVAVHEAWRYTDRRREVPVGGWLSDGGAAAELPEPPGQSGTPGTRIAALFSRVSSAGQQPFAFVWQHPPGAASWRLVQSLGADSLGSIGSARLTYPDANGVVLVSRATVPARGFDECATCAHVDRMRSFR